MDLKKLYKLARISKKENIELLFTVPYGTKRPKGFPKGETVAAGREGNIVRFDPEAVLAWFEKQGDSV